MKKVSILTVNSKIPNFFLYPVRKNKRHLREMGYDIHIFLKPKAKHLSSDILCLSSKYFTKWWHEPENIFEFIDKAKKCCTKIIWLDDSDSTGVTHFELLPHIDLYLKKQLLKDKTLYTKPLYGDRIFTDFYHREFNIKDETPYQSKPLDMALFHKVHLSWNLGLGDYAGDRWPRYIRFFKNYLPPVYPENFTAVDRPRPIDVICRGTRSYARKSISYHRERIGEILDGMTELNMALTDFVHYSRYVQEIKDSKVFISPFGWGEISFKDFEVWIYGSVLIKPDVSHMETWPDVFIPFETYYPINWNFDNLETGIKQLLEDDQLRLKLAENGQNAYARMVSDNGMCAFCDWFSQQIEK